MPYHGSQYWLTPRPLMRSLKKEFRITYDACPYPRPRKYNGLKARWGKSTYVNPPFKGPTAWARKAIAENAKGKTVVMVFPTDKWIHYLLNAGAELRSLGDVRWCHKKTKKPGKGIGRFTMMFILRGENMKKEKQNAGLVCSKCGVFGRFGSRLIGGFVTVWPANGSTAKHFCGKHKP